MALSIWFLIVCAVLLGRHLFWKWVDSWPLPDPPAPTKPPYQNWPRCKIHGTYIDCQISSRCPDCERDYHSEMSAKIYPPGINDSNAEWFILGDWQELRLIDLAWEAGEITEAEALAKKKKYIKETVLIRPNLGQITDIANKKAASERCSHYAGAAEYSGITIPK